MITIHDKNFNIIQANKAAQRFLNLPDTPLSENAVKCFKFYHGTKSPPIGCPSCRCFETMEPAVFETFEPHLKRFIEVRAMPRFNSKKEFVGLMHFVRDITAQKKFLRQLENSREELRRLNEYLNDMREKERKHISHEIHDELGQILTALKLEMFLMKKKLEGKDTALKKKASEVLRLIDSSIETVQKISYSLRPGVLDDFGLPAAIEWQVEEFQKRTGIEASVTINSRLEGLQRKSATTIFRVLQEALTNVARHSQATRVKASLHKHNGKLKFSVNDNGKGLSEEKLSDNRSLGLIGMRERVNFIGGEITIKGKKGKGTTIDITVPYK
jgi:two-component system sensor histidine kinase UhpB